MDVLIDLSTVRAGLLAFMALMYVVADGFDFGCRPWSWWASPRNGDGRCWSEAWRCLHRRTRHPRFAQVGRIIGGRFWMSDAGSTLA